MIEVEVDEAGVECSGRVGSPGHKREVLTFTVREFSRDKSLQMEMFAVSRIPTQIQDVQRQAPKRRQKGKPVDHNMEH
jgi:hypothetical protein